MADQNTQGGQGAAAAAPSAPAAPAAPAAAPASSPSSSSSNAPQGAPGAQPGAAPSVPASAGAPAPAAGASSPAAGAPAAAPARVIEGMPPRGTDEYWAKFDTLSPEDKYKVEAEWKDVDSGAAEAPKPADPNAPKKDDPAAKPLPGDKPAENGEDLFLDESFVAALPEREQKAVRAMQATLDQFGDLMTPEFQEGMDRMVKDPLIKMRMEEMAAGNVWEPGELAKEFNPDTYVKAEELEKLDPVTDPDGFRNFHRQLAKQAYEDGLKKGSFATEYKMQQQIAFAERKSKFDVGFNKLAEAHPELKAKDPSIKEYHDPRHPMHAFIKWAGANYRDEFFMKNENSFEAAYASFLASGGKLDQAITSHVQRANLKFIRNVEQATKTAAATVGRNTSTAAPSGQPLVPGVDADRYLSDPDYARKAWDSADFPTRQKLEQLRYGRLKQPA